MEFEIPQKNLKLFVQALKCLSSVSNNFVMIGARDELCLRTINETETLYGVFHFTRSFFTKVSPITLGGSSIDSTHATGSTISAPGSMMSPTSSIASSSASASRCTCTLPSKTCAAMFNANRIKEAVSCVLRMNKAAQAAEFIIYTRTGSRGRIQIPFLEEFGNEEKIVRINDSISSCFEVDGADFLSIILRFFKKIGKNEDFIITLPVLSAPSLNDPDASGAGASCVVFETLPSPEEKDFLLKSVRSLSIGTQFFQRYEIEAPPRSLDEGGYGDDGVCREVKFGINYSDLRFITEFCSVAEISMTVRVTEPGKGVFISAKHASGSYSIDFVLATLEFESISQLPKIPNPPQSAKASQRPPKTEANDDDDDDDENNNNNNNEGINGIGRFDDYQDANIGNDRQQHQQLDENNDVDMDNGIGGIDFDGDDNIINNNNINNDNNVRNGDNPLSPPTLKRFKEDEQQNSESILSKHGNEPHSRSGTFSLQNVKNERLSSQMTQENNNNNNNGNRSVSNLQPNGSYGGVTMSEDILDNTHTQRQAQQQQQSTNQQQQRVQSESLCNARLFSSNVGNLNMDGGLEAALRSLMGDDDIEMERAAAPAASGNNNSRSSSGASVKSENILFSNGSAKRSGNSSGFDDDVIPGTCPH